ncbi:MAG TPA: hypothetical protein VK527_09220 [Candidatus Limnocylindrales bacterium]|nr:hypothetical protein [Candidatus Limnocylindrales bacterium]
MRRAVLFAVSFWLLVFLAVAQIAILRGRWSAPSLGPEQWLVLIVILALQIMLLIVPSRLISGLPVGGGFLLAALAASGFLFAVLLFSIEMAFGEYTRLLNDASIWTVVFPVVAGIGYAFVLHRRSRRMAAERLLRHQCWTLLIAGALVLAAIIPAHLMTVRRGGFLVGIGTALGMILSVLVILLALGQLLFSLLCARSTSRRTQPPGAPAPPTHA